MRGPAGGAVGGALSARGRGRRGFSDINVTPLVDVMLVLLIVFMVTAPLLTAGLGVDLPRVEAQGAPAPEPAPVVTVTREGRVLLGEEDITARVARALEADIRIQARKELLLRADDGARYGVVAQVVAAARAAGVTGLHLLVQPSGERPR